MQFDTWDKASEYIAKLTPRLADGFKGGNRETSTIRLFDIAGEIPWVGILTDSGSDSAWDKLCITALTHWEAIGVSDARTRHPERGPFVVLVCRFPKDSLRYQYQRRETYRRIMRTEPVIVNSGESSEIA